MKSMLSVCLGFLLSFSACKGLLAQNYLYDTGSPTFSAQWRGTALEGSPIEPDVISEFDWQDRRHGNDGQFDTALKTVTAELQL